MNSICGWRRAVPRKEMLMTVLGALAMLWHAAPAWAQNATEAADAAAGSEAASQWHFYVIWAVAFVGSVVALVQAWRFYKQMMAADEGTPQMVEIAGYVREGANAYLRQQYKIVAMFFVVIFGLLGRRGLRAQRAEQVGAVRLPHRRVLLRPGRLVRHEDRHLGQQPHRRRRPEVAQPGPAGRLPLRGRDGPDRRRPGPAGHHACGSSCSTGSCPRSATTRCRWKKSR